MGRITKRVVEAAPAEAKDYFIWDDELPGFGVRIFTSGKRSYLIQYRAQGRSRRLTIGRHGICGFDDITPHILRHSFASIANDLGFTETTVAALLGHAKGSVTGRYIHTMDAALIAAADTVAGYIQGLLDGAHYKLTAYALDHASRKQALASFLAAAVAEEHAADASGESLAA